MTQIFKIPLALFLTFLQYEICAQAEFIEYKGEKYKKDDSAEVCVFSAKRELQYHQGNFYYRNDKKKISPLKPDTVFYLPCYLNEYAHTRAAYLYLDQKGRIIGREYIHVTVSSKHYLYTFRHQHSLTFLLDSINGYPLKMKKLDFFELKEVWSPPKF